MAAPAIEDRVCLNFSDMKIGILLSRETSPVCVHPDPYSPVITTLGVDNLSNNKRLDRVDVITTKTLPTAVHSVLFLLMFVLL